MNFRLCKICAQEKPYSKAGGKNKKASGFYGAVCWACFLRANVKRSAAWRVAPESRASYLATVARTYVKRRSTEVARVADNAANAKTAAKRRSTEAGRTKANAACLTWQKQYPGKANARNAKRHAAKLARIPLWADLEAIKQVYTEAAKQGLAVDHIIPLQGKLVSGLHVASNLQLLSKIENSSKGNRYAV